MTSHCGPLLTGHDVTSMQFGHGFALKRGPYIYIYMVEAIIVRKRMELDGMLKGCGILVCFQLKLVMIE